MKTIGICFLIALILGVLGCSNLMADTITLADLPNGDIDTLSIQLTPLNGEVDGLAGASLGWGFTLDWTSTLGDWISFTSSSLGSLAQGETNPGLLASYTDFIGVQGGPVDFGLAPGTWTEAFDGVSQGVGVYQITTDPSVALPGAEDTGQITFNFQVYNGDPLTTGQQIGDGSYSYFGPSTAFSVTVDAPEPTPTSEPATFVLVFAGFGILAVGYWRRTLFANVSVRQ